MSKYKYKGKTYVITELSIRKDLASGNWIPCVIYRQMGSGNLYVRDAHDFESKFVKYE